MTVHRIEVRPADGRSDPRGYAARVQAMSSGLDCVPRTVATAQVFLVEGDLNEASLHRLANELLCDPVTESMTIGASPMRSDAIVEVHPLPGVMDPAAQAVERAVEHLLGTPVAVRTGVRYDMHGVTSNQARTVAERCLANTVIHGIHERPHHPATFPGGHEHDMVVPEVPLADLDDAALEKLSREAHLFLDLSEMQAIRAHYCDLGRHPRAIELETLAQTWSEHCVHKTLKATIRYAGPIADVRRPGYEYHEDGTVTIHNLLKSTVAAATRELMDDGIDWCLSVFVDNAGIVAFDDNHAVCFKVETHNHPSALEPYGGAATGIGGCIRDIIGTGLAARPIAATDVFCVGELGNESPPAGCLRPRRILCEVVRGVRDYGNRMGIPTLNGGVWFDDEYVGNPLVYCGCVGVMPRTAIEGDPRPGDRIIALGGRTGRDGIHGATFSSAELTDMHADEFSHAVQIGNAITEKKMLDAILEARDHAEGCIFTAITDCGAGGFSSAVGEMGEHLGATVQLERAPLKYAGLTPHEIWISEAQERMVLAVSSHRVPLLQSICDRHDVELCDLGEFGTPNSELILRFDDTEVGRLDMAFMHGGLPDTVRTARWSPPATSQQHVDVDVQGVLPQMLAMPNIASKRCIIEQYDHEVQGRSVIRPFAGPGGGGPSDAAVITPVRGLSRGLAIGNGLATGLRDDPWLMAAVAVDECVRNITCVGGDPSRIAILDNFCWPGVKDEESLGALVRCAEGCYDAAMAYRTPFISGKDSLNNQFTTEDGCTIRIPPTLLISGFGIVADVGGCVTMDAKSPESVLVLIGRSGEELGGSHLAMLLGFAGSLPPSPLEDGPHNAAAVHRLIKAGLVRAAHDCSEGGVLVAAAEMAFAGGIGLDLDLPADATCFTETPARYLLEMKESDLAGIGDVDWTIVGRFNGSDRLSNGIASWSLDELRSAWESGVSV
jgi:phosphoribosylformylglycinamidine synthase